jgi:hypothetical protein
MILGKPVAEWMRPEILVNDPVGFQKVIEIMDPMLGYISVKN